MRVLKPILRQLLWHPFRPIITDDQRTWKSYELYLAALHLATAIDEATDRAHIGVMLPTSGLFPAALIAGWLLGKTVVPLNYLLKNEDLAYVIDNAELDAVVTVKPMVEHFGPLPESVTQLRMDEMAFRGLPRFRRCPKKAGDDIAVLLYTSGTSGRPKGVMLTVENLASNVEQCVEWADFDSRDTLVGVLPQFHSFGLTVLTLLPLSVGCKVVYTARFAPKRMLDLFKKHSVSALIAIPSMYNALLHAKSATPEHFETFRFLVSGGEPLPEGVANGFFERFGVRINEGYGLTETSPVSNMCLLKDYKPRSVGQPLPRVQEKIIDTEGNSLGPNQDGEVCIAGPNVMAGYYKLPEETARVLDTDGFFHTGDMGRFDDDGHLYITGRFKEMLIIGGENVFPREIEEVLNAHPAVSDSAVIGMQDESRGEVALAFIELVDDAAFDETELRSHCREHLAQYKVPRDIRVLDALPRNPTGKIMRRELNSETLGKNTSRQPASPSE